ncbi:hypothetical protein JOF36_004625 [Pseudonocardia parietis]|uniref:Transposase n=1 Tax=Pseudonocardia parietis TaxID=570936 RepID=A0ABS4VYD9_9PSEU|nr:hypothetical protein [Pseudonocardia parietis]
MSLWVTPEQKIVTGRYTAWPAETHTGHDRPDVLERIF